MGPKMADKNERTFTEEQLRAHEGELNLQMGYNKGASQSGVGGFGNTRHMWDGYIVMPIRTHTFIAASYYVQWSDYFLLFFILL